MIRLHLDGQSA